MKKDKIDINYEEPPPIMGSWNKLYGLVLANLILLIIIFYIFTKVFE